MGPWEGLARFLAPSLVTNIAVLVDYSAFADFLVAGSCFDFPVVVVVVVQEVHTVGSLGLCYNHC